MLKTELMEKIYETSYLTGLFQLRTGKMSSEYFDKYLFESDPELLKEIAKAMSWLMPENVEAVAGLQMGGIPIATMLSQETGLQQVFVRKEAKEYGTCKLAEGCDVENKRLVIIEDVVTSGGQVIISVADLRNLGAIVEDVLCVIDREAGAYGALENEGLRLHRLFRMTELKLQGEKSRREL